MSANKNDGAKYVGDKHNLETLPLDIAQLVQNDWKNQRPQEWPFFEPIDKYASLLLCKAECMYVFVCMHVSVFQSVLVTSLRKHGSFGILILLHVQAAKRELFAAC